MPPRIDIDAVDALKIEAAQGGCLPLGGRARPEATKAASRSSQYRPWMRDFEKVAAFPDQSGTPVSSCSGDLRCAFRSLHERGQQFGKSAQLNEPPLSASFNRAKGQ